MKQKKKLFLVSPMLHQGGFERVCVRTAHLLKDIMDVSIVIFSDENIAYDVEGLNIINLNCPVQSNRIAKVINVIKRANRLKKLKVTAKPDVVYSFGPTANFVNALSYNKSMRQWMGLRSYTDFDNSFKFRTYIKRADFVVCCSKEIEHRLTNEYSINDCTTLYNPFDIDTINREALGEVLDWPWDEIDPVSSKHTKTFIALGANVCFKNYWHMIKVFSLIHKANAESRLIILGQGDFSNCKDLTKALGIEDVVYFGGMKKDPYKYLKKSDFYFMTSGNEGFPNALVEGMSMGLATISTNCMTGPAEILLEGNDINCNSVDTLIDNNNGILYGDYGVLIKTMGEEEDYSSNITDRERNAAHSIVKFINDEKLVSEYGLKALNRAKDFSAEAYVGKLTALINDGK